MLPRGVALGGGHRPPLRPRGAADLRPCEVQTWGSSPPKFLGRSIHSSLPFFFLFFYKQQPALSLPAGPSKATLHLQTCPSLCSPRSTRIKRSQ